MASIPSATTQRSVCPDTTTPFPLGEAENALLQDHASSPSSGAANVPGYRDQHAEQVFSISTNASDRDKDKDFHGSALAPSLSLPTMSPSVCLPAELWSMTLSNLRGCKTLEDFDYLWLTARHVSRLFRDEIENIFMEGYMRETGLHVCYFPAAETEHISGSLHGSVWQYSGDVGYPATVSFSHFEENDQKESIAKQLAVYRHEGGGPWLDDLYEKLGHQESVRCEISLWHWADLAKGSTTWLRGFEVDLLRSDERTFVVQERGLDEIRLPASRIDIGKRTFSLEWKEMLTYLFRQQLADA